MLFCYFLSPSIVHPKSKKLFSMNQLNEDYITINDTNYNLQALNPWPGKISQRIRQEKMV
jgi:hypothetical protein